MPRKQAAKPVTIMVPHRSPQLAELLEAAKTCSIEPVRRFLAAGGLPDTIVELAYNDGTSTSAPLVFEAIVAHRIAQCPGLHHASLELLLQAGANANAVCKDASGREFTPLMAACDRTCCAAPMRLLLVHGADPALQTSTGEAALHSAAKVGRADVCEMLLAADGCQLEVRDRAGMTPLARAVQHGHLQVVELLHRQWGADLNIQISKGDTLLHLAAAAPGRQTLLEYLLRNGLDVNAVMLGAITPVCIAAQTGDIAAVQTLLEHGASLTAVTEHGYSVLMLAVQAGHTDVVKLLLSSGGSSGQPALNVNAATTEGSTALHYGSMHRSH
jgi:ankyrin repeat protein